MRVITGVARGRRLLTVPGNELVRPTSEKVKEALFSSIQFDIEGRRVLDLFAGCGQLGIEALSRGAATATFVDSSDVSLNVVKKNLDSVGLSDNAIVMRSDYSTFLMHCNEIFDFAFLDPPYNSGILLDALEKTVGKMSDYGKIFCEHPSNCSLPESVGDFKVFKAYKYGKISLTVYAKKEALDE